MEILLLMVYQNTSAGCHEIIIMETTSVISRYVDVKSLLRIFLPNDFVIILTNRISLRLYKINILSISLLYDKLLYMVGNYEDFVYYSPELNINDEVSL
jgi:hypothetical protein